MRAGECVLLAEPLSNFATSTDDPVAYTAENVVKSRKQQAKRLLEFCYFLHSTSLDKNFGHNHTLQTLQVKMIIPNY